MGVFFVLLLNMIRLFSQRYLMGDILNLLPHSKKENKLDQKKNLGSLNEMAEMASCNKVVYLESRKGTDLFMWVANAPNGPSIKFQVLNGTEFILFFFSKYWFLHLTYDTLWG
jgi:hypothetical protein